MKLSESHERWASANHDSYREGQEHTDYLVSIIKAYIKKEINKPGVNGKQKVFKRA